MLRESISIDDLVSEIAQTDEDAFSGKFCECGHLLSEHCAGKCYSFNHNGANFWQCFCKSKRQMIFKIEIEIFPIVVYLDANIFSNERIAT